MNKVDFRMVNGEIDQDKYQKLIDDLKKDSFVQSYFLKKNIPISVLSSNAYQVDRWRKTRKKIDERNFFGYMEGLEFNGLLQDVLEPSPLQQEQMEKERHLEYYLVNDLPSAFTEVRFEKINLMGETPSYTKTVQVVANACLQHMGIYLYGHMGTGKSYLAACAANFYAEQKKKVAYIHYPSFCERVSSRLKTGEYRYEVARLTYVDFLVIDDIGAEEVTEKSNSILLNVLDVRMNHNLLTWFTSNEDFQSLQQRLSNTNRATSEMQALRILERMKTLSKPIKVIEKDRRNLSQIVL